MTSSADPPLVRERATIGAVRTRGTFQFVFAAGFALFGVIASANGAAWWTVAIAGLGAVLLTASGVVAWWVAGRRLTRFEAEHGVGAGVRRRADAVPSPDPAAVAATQSSTAAGRATGAADAAPSRAPD